MEEFISPCVLQEVDLLRVAASSSGPRALDKDWMKKGRPVMAIAEGANPTDLRSEFGL